MLFLTVHTVEAVTATVPFNMVVLLDLVKRRALPEHLKCRFVFPTSGSKSVSVWEAPSMDELKAWLDQNLGSDCTSEVSELQEDFTYGISVELARARAAERGREGLDDLREGAQVTQRTQGPLPFAWLLVALPCPSSILGAQNPLDSNCCDVPFTKQSGFARGLLP